jgi:hypothetical protein
MPNQVTCPSCARPLRVPDSLPGQAVKCPSCEATFDAVEAPPPADAIREPADAPVRRRESAPPRDPDLAPRPRPRLDDQYDDDDYDEDDDDFEYRRRRRRPYRAAHRGGLILTLGILSLVFCLLAIVCIPVGGFIGIAPWVMGVSDLRRMKEGSMDDDGRGSTKTGMIMGIVATSLNALLLVGGITVAIITNL